MKIVITLEVPEGTRVASMAGDVVGGGSGGGGYVPPFADEMIPLPDEAVPVPGDYQPHRTAAQNTSPGLCPVHRLPWKSVPAGVSKRTGKPYDSFASCPERGCDQRP